MLLLWELSLDFACCNFMANIQCPGKPVWGTEGEDERPHNGLIKSISLCQPLIYKSRITLHYMRKVCLLWICANGAQGKERERERENMCTTISGECLSRKVRILSWSWIEGMISGSASKSPIELRPVLSPVQLPPTCAYWDQSSCNFLLMKIPHTYFDLGKAWT